MCVNAIGMFVLYSTLNIILTIGSIELKDVAELHNTMWKVLIVFSAMTTVILTQSLFDHALSARCDTHEYPLSIDIAHSMSTIFIIMSITVYFRTVKCKRELLKV